MDELLRNGGPARLALQLVNESRDPSLSVSRRRWLALRAELEDAYAAQQRAGREAEEARRAEEETEVLARARTVLGDWQTAAGVATARELFGALLADGDTNRAKVEYRRLARATHPDSGGDPRVFAQLATAWAAYRERMGVP